MKRTFIVAIIWLASLASLPSATEKLAGNIKVVGNVQVKGAVVGGGSATLTTEDAASILTSEDGTLIFTTEQ